MIRKLHVHEILRMHVGNLSNVAFLQEDLQYLEDTCNRC